MLRGGGEPGVDGQPDEARHLDCCAGCGEALSRAKEKPLKGSPDHPELSSGNGASNSALQAGQFGRRRHVGVRRCRLCEQGH